MADMGGQGNSALLGRNSGNSKNNSVSMAFQQLLQNGSVMGQIADYQSQSDKNYQQAVSDYKNAIANYSNDNTGYNLLLGQIQDSGTFLSGLQNNISNIYNQLGNVSNGLGGQISQIQALEGKINPVYSRLNTIDDALSGIANSISTQLPPYTDKLNQMGNSIFGTGQSLIDYGGVFGQQAQQLMGMDASAGGLVGEYVNALQGISPDRYVSQAATDVQNSYQNAMAQQNRALARSGVDAGSARSTALNQQYAQAMATASAGAKTRARQQGLNERFAAINTVFGTANTLAQTGLSAQSAGLNAQNAGAGIIGSAGNLFLSGANQQAQIQSQRNAVQQQWLNAVNQELALQQAQTNVYNAQTQAFGAQTQALNAQTNAEKMKLDGATALAEMSNNNQNALLAAYKNLADLQIQQAVANATASNNWIDIAEKWNPFQALFFAGISQNNAA